jgi:hypothetical protein
MKRQTRRLGLRKLTVRTLEASAGGWHYISQRYYCSDSCNTCYVACGLEPDETDFRCYSDSPICYFC